MEAFLLCTIQWVDTGACHNVVIKAGSIEDEDDYVFYYVDTLDDFLGLFSKEEEFVVTKLHEVKILDTVPVKGKEYYVIVNDRVVKSTWNNLLDEVTFFYNKRDAHDVLNHSKSCIDASF